MPHRSMRFTRLMAVLVGLLFWTGCGDDDGGGNPSGVCGDGEVDAGEVCDDGNTAEGDGCSPTCQREEEVRPRCGNGEADAGEACDDGNTADGDGCSAECEIEAPPRCGDGAADPGEQCDDGNRADGDGCEADCTETPPKEIVCEALAPLEQGTCEVVPGAGATLIRGTVLTPRTIYRGGRVLVDERGTIACVGCDCEAAGATEITCPRGVVSPSLINTHDHITFTQNSPYTPTEERYEHRHDWRTGNNQHTEIETDGSATEAQIQWGELRFLMGGATSIVGAGSAPGLLRNLDRAEQEGLDQKPVNFETFPLRDSSGRELASGCGYSGEMVTGEDIEGEDAYCPHVAEGIEASARNEFICLQREPNDVLQPQSAYIHGIGLTALDYAAMAVNGTALIWSPRSNITLYGDTAVVTAAARLGVQIALGTDWVATGSMNLLRELRCAASLNERYYDGFFTDEELWRMVTGNAAAVTATDDVIGALSTGKIADIAIFNGAEREDHRAIVAAEPEDVVLVMRGGTVLYGDAALVAAVRGAEVCNELDVCGVAKQVCLQDEVGMTLEELEREAGESYPAFFCGEPEREPLCTPWRAASAPVNASVNGSTVYTGQPTDEDLDGDGIADEADDCPSVFNPIRPLDNGAQADFDGDGDGDACDACPLDAGSTLCAELDPDDSDNDGVLNGADSCPSHQNPEQADMDGDGKGDPCDPCPAEANPGTRGCTVSIYDIKDGTVAEGATVALENALVTGKHANGFFVQAKPGDPGYAGPAYSGVYVYSAGSAVAVGDRVRITSAVVTNFYGQIQLGSVAVEVLASLDEAAPAPEPVAPADIATGGPRAAELEGVLVEVEDVEVIGLETMYKEFIVTGDLRVDDLLYEADPFPAVGDGFTRIRGILNYRNDNSKVEPRSAEDLVAGPPRLAAFGPAASFAYVGQTAAPTVPAPLEVTLSKPAAADTFVAVTSGDPAAIAVVGGGVTVPAGATSAAVLLDALVAAEAVTLTATLRDVSLTAAVSVLDPVEAPALAALDPASATVAPGGTVSFTVTLDIPALPDGAVVALALDPPGAGTLPASVAIPGGQQSATFDYVDGGSVAGVTVTATLGESSLTATVETVTVTGGLVINEVDYDQENTDGAEFIEIYNGTGAPVDLAGHALLLINGASDPPAPYQTFDLGPAGTIAAGQYLVVGSTTAVGTVPEGALTIAFSGTQTNRVQNGGPAGAEEPDGIALVNTTTGSLIDALSYEGSITAVTIGEVSVSLVEGEPLPASVADVNDAPRSLCRLPNGMDTNQAAADWALSATITPGAANVP
ncbi:lamin tail domain-containing protein [Sorangium sp. So ce1078]|uniref:lamin tail domain-containing protein n=1 Tax=Sorangium sp. So ce1078 TaxID=3133329 RepID=UPI003F5F189F